MGACTSKSGNQILHNETTIKDLQKNIKDKLIKHEDKTKNKIYKQQNIKIISKIPSDIINSPFYQEKIETHNWLGFKSGEKPLYGCNYDISQTSDFKIVSIKKDALKDSTKIFNTIKSKLKKEVDAELTNDTPGAKALNNAISGSERDVVTKINEIINKATETKSGSGQSIDIISNTPIRCDEEGKGPTLNQDADMYIMTNNILSSAMEIINKNISKKGLSSKLKYKDSNMACTIQMVASAIFCIIILVLLLKMG